MLSDSHLLSTIPTPDRIWFKVHHQTDPPTSPNRTLPPPIHIWCEELHSIGYPSSNNLHTHLPNKEILNSLNRFTPKPPFSVCKHIVSHLIQDIFLTSSPPHPNFFAKDRINGINNT